MQTEIIDLNAIVDKSPDVYSKIDPGLLKRACSGVTDAQLLVGLELDGYSLFGKKTLGLPWLRSAAINGNAEAKGQVARRLYYGGDKSTCPGGTHGDHEDRETCREFAKAAAEAGDAWGQVVYGGLIAEDDGAMIGPAQLLFHTNNPERAVRHRCPRAEALWSEAAKSKTWAGETARDMLKGFSMFSEVDAKAKEGALDPETLYLLLEGAMSGLEGLWGDSYKYGVTLLSDWKRASALADALLSVCNEENRLCGPCDPPQYKHKDGIKLAKDAKDSLKRLYPFALDVVDRAFLADCAAEGVKEAIDMAYSGAGFQVKDRAQYGYGEALATIANRYSAAAVKARVDGLDGRPLEAFAAMWMARAKAAGWKA